MQSISVPDTMSDQPISIDTMRALAEYERDIDSLFQKMANDPRMGDASDPGNRLDQLTSAVSILASRFLGRGSIAVYDRFSETKPEIAARESATQAFMGLGVATAQRYMGMIGCFLDEGELPGAGELVSIMDANGNEDIDSAVQILRARVRGRNVH